MLGAATAKPDRYMCTGDDDAGGMFLASNLFAAAGCIGLLVRFHFVVGDTQPRSAAERGSVMTPSLGATSQLLTWYMHSKQSPL